MKKHTLIILICIAVLIGFSCLASPHSLASYVPITIKEQNARLINIRVEYNQQTTNPYAILETSMGTINIELFEDLVPHTVDNFIKLVNISFYDGLVFHRVIDDFVIQGGGYYPNGTQKESPFGSIDLELHPRARHYDGAIGMARTSDPNSATSQFYICDGPQLHLDDNYAVFGRVTLKTRSVIRDIASVETTTKYGLQDWPVDDILIDSMTIQTELSEVDSLVQHRVERYSHIIFFLHRVFHLLQDTYPAECD